MGMQQFKLLLSKALSTGIVRIQIGDSKPVELTKQDFSKIVDGSAVFYNQDILQILAAILPGQKLGDSGFIEGAMNVGTMGILKIRATTNPLLLSIYSSAGEDLFLQDLNSPQNKAPEVAVVQNPEPVVSIVPPLQVSFSPQPSSPSSPQSSSSIPSPTLEKPAEMVAAPSAKPLKAAAQEPASGMMFHTTIAKPSKSEAAASSQAAAPSLAIKDHPPVNQGLVLQQPIVVQSPVAEEETAEINFGSSEKSEGSKSEGNNSIDRILKEMVQLKASDLHLTVGQPVIFRVHGDISRVGQEMISAETMESYILPTMPPRNKKEFAKISDTDYAYELVGIGRFRVNVFRDRNGVGAVLRHIPSQILTAEQLNLSPAILKLCTLNKGLVLVTGPTGSGKSTTLAAMLDYINKNRKEHILTVEDPIEFVHPQQSCLVNQREVHKHTGSFARALKAALREDPDVVLIGEMRDLETIAIAIETAETGHLVFGTLHTTTAISTVDRIIDQFPADRQAQIRTMLAGSLRGVVAQTLLKKKSGGRIAAHEILITNDAVSAMIREGKIQHLANHMLTQKADGNQLLNESLLKLVQEGVIDIQDAFFKSVDKNSFLAMARTRGLTVAAA